MPKVTVSAAGEQTAVNYTVGVTDPYAVMKPKSYANWQAAVSDLGLPTDPNYVVYKPEWATWDLERVFKVLGTNDVLVLPERAEPYTLDATRGFPASGVVDMEYLSDADYAANGYNTKIVSGIAPVVSVSRLWFELARARRGVLGLGPGAVIQPVSNGWKGQRQPKTSMIITYSGGSKGTMVGVQQKLMGFEHKDPIMANVVLKGANLGTVAYSGFAFGKTGGRAVIRRVHVDKAWSGFAGIPNGEAGGIAIGGFYDVRGLYLETDEAYSSSPIMWNRAQGGYMKDVYVGKHRIGMITQWKSEGVHNWENVTTNAGTVGINLEEDLDSFVLNWTGGAINCVDASNSKHLNINPSQGSINVHLTGVAIRGKSGLAPVAANEPAKLVAHAYGVANKQKKADITCDTAVIAYVPNSALWT